jgi:hypothetical protein
MRSLGRPPRGSEAHHGVVGDERHRQVHGQRHGDPLCQFPGGQDPKGGKRTPGQVFPRLWGRTAWWAGARRVLRCGYQGPESVPAISVIATR